MMNLDTWLREWLVLRTAELAPRTVDQYKDLIDRYVSPLIGSIDMRDVSPQDLRSMLATVAGTGKTRTAELIYAMLSAAMKELDVNPMLHVKRPSHRQKRVEPWTDAEIARYLSALYSHRHGLALSLGLLCGLRRGEICGLRWRDVDLNAEELHIVNQRQRLASGEIVDTRPKSATSVRVIPIPRPLLPFLRAARGLPSAYVDSITPSGLDTAHRQLVEKLGLPPICLHGLRHCYATLCLRHGCDMRCLQSLLGHSSYSVTANIYTHPDREMLRHAIDAVIDSCYTVLRSNTASGT